MGVCTSATAKMRSIEEPKKQFNSSFKKSDDLIRTKTLSLKDTKGYRKCDKIRDIY